MRNLRTKFERFCLKNRNKGIPNLMLYIVIASAVVYLLSLFNGGTMLYDWLCFDKRAVLQGEVWRLLTHILTYAPGSNPLLTLIGLYFFYHISRSVESTMGTFRFNLYYFTGVILMDVFAMVFCPIEPVIIGNHIVNVAELYSNMAWYLHLGLVLTFCCTCPDAQFLVFFIIPVKAWFIALLDIFLIAVDIFNLAQIFPHNLFPLVGLANFLIFSGKDILNLLPPGLRPNPYRSRKNKARQKPPIQFTPRKKESSADYTHKCTQCGRTDVSHPNLEFRYCSRCKGFHCYCQEHISNHEHITEE